MKLFLSRYKLGLAYLSEQEEESEEDEKTTDILNKAQAET